MEYQRILYSVDDRVARITLNRPSKRNALDDIMVREITTAVSLAGRDATVKALVLAANGPSFCAGADLAYLDRVSKFDLEQNRADSFRLANMYRTLYEVRKPVIAVVRGPAVAGGCGLASVCDFILASAEHAQFGYTEVRIGFLPAIVLVFLAKRVGEGRARELVLRGNLINANDARELGLVSMVLPEAALADAEASLIRDLVNKNSAGSMALCKEMLSRLQGMNLVDALDFAANMNAAARMTPDAKQGFAAFLKKEKPVW